jgi:hypothetical protein
VPVSAVGAVDAAEPGVARPPSAPKQVVEVTEVMLPLAPGPPAFQLPLLSPTSPPHIETPTLLLLASPCPPGLLPLPPLPVQSDACAATSAVFSAADCADASAASTACARLNVASRSAAATVAAFDADCDAAVVITRADVSIALAAPAFDANLAVAAASVTAARAVLRRSRSSVGDVCAAAARAFTSIARDRMLSLRDLLLEINSGVARAAFAPTRLATTRRGEADLPPNVLVLPLSKGCTVRSRSLPQHFE